MYLLTLGAVEINSLPHLVPSTAAVFHLPDPPRHRKSRGYSEVNNIRHFAFEPTLSQECSRTAAAANNDRRMTLLLQQLPSGGLGLAVWNCASSPFGCDNNAIRSDENALLPTEFQRRIPTLDAAGDRRGYGVPRNFQEIATVIPCPNA